MKCGKYIWITAILMIKETYLKEPPDSIHKKTKDNVLKWKEIPWLPVRKLWHLKHCRVG